MLVRLQELQLWQSRIEGETLEIDLDSIDQMLALGRQLGEAAEAGDCIVLCGDLGAGKTQLTKGIAQGLGITQVITSPTFNLVIEYHDGRLPLYHFDFYRFEYEEELEDIGYYEIVDARDEAAGLCVIEWGDKYPAALPPCYLDISIQVTGATLRQLKLRWQDATDITPCSNEGECTC